jgi:SAM-dependent methyltransferase
MEIMKTRLEKILACIDTHTEKGLEVGALMNPIVTPNMGNIRYIDHATTAALQAKYAHDPNVDIHKIVNVDYVWGEEGLPDLVGHDVPFDYLVASHVIEHVPDFIGWLKEVHAVLKVGGILSLVIPDKRYCFDHHRPLTEASDVVGAFLTHSRKPSPQQVFEYFSSVVHYDGQITWDQTVATIPEKFSPIHSHLDAWNLASHSLLEGQYIDTHCWVFTPESFFNLLKTLMQIGLLGFSVEKFYETEGCEFYVSLKALDLLSMTESDRQLIQVASLPVIPASTDSQTLLLSKQKRIQRLRKELAAATDRINAMESSKFWQLRSQWFKVKQMLKLPTDD